MMYEELVRCLRGHSQKMGCTDNCICEDSDKRGFGTCSEELAKLAADAIEKLQKALDAVNDAHNEGYDVGYWAGRRDYEPKWIPVTERLPEYGDWVLGIGPKKGYHVCEYRGISHFVYGGDSPWFSAKGRAITVTHWMPLPEPPKEAHNEL